MLHKWMMHKGKKKTIQCFSIPVIYTKECTLKINQQLWEI